MGARGWRWRSLARAWHVELVNHLTADGQQLIQSLSSRYGLSQESAYTMLVAVSNGGGSMAQFYCPELGSGQWMRGGMTMVSDMFNHGLKSTVNNLCEELSNALASFSKSSNKATSKPPPPSSEPASPIPSNQLHRA